MKRRTFLEAGVALGLSSPLWGAARRGAFDDAADVLAKSVADGLVESAVLRVTRRGESYTRVFGQAKSADALFLLGSITKPICITALMTLYDRGEFALDDRVEKFLPQFQGGERSRVTLRHLMSHVSGLPDQLPENDRLRASHAGLEEFVAQALRTPLAFVPGTRYQYSSMGILLASHVAERISGTTIHTLTQEAVFNPLGMERAALGLGKFQFDELLPCQVQHAAPEAGGGDPATAGWDWNSPYWRKLGAPWGGAHVAAPDLEKFLAEFLSAQGQCVQPETARQMVANQNGKGITPRGLGFAVGQPPGNSRFSEKTFGHTGSTGTLARADPETETICIVLTSLPARAIDPHPRDQAAQLVASATKD
ncbi:MAG: serine hydrolase domain-containing protein [Planctomycetales bacterium]